MLENKNKTKRLILIAQKHEPLAYALSRKSSEVRAISSQNYNYADAPHLLVCKIKQLEAKRNRIAANCSLHIDFDDYPQIRQ